ncbi:DUF2752 domain-containing protein [Roseibacillus persicicus]|uniref:DUF2752 domain-containing protein n=1 Tax=Roseibacillus persicicus TaxID=454148 RepID=A0A918TTQ3_9BACT|nr:DUF2752 domain-containing protein [Roseibacillus persicicus]GHC62514.1 hypothetical protein GCM10007100_32430 [Roseibacillus persicicus]
MRWLWRQSGRWVLISALLRERAVTWILLGFAFLYLLFAFFNIPIWRCVWRMFTGWRCPGCGLTTGCKAFLRGDFVEGLAWNWLTPFVLIALILFPVVMAIPKRVREPFLDRLERVERKFRLTLVLLVLVVVQTIARLQGWA